MAGNQNSGKPAREEYRERLMASEPYRQGELMDKWKIAQILGVEHSAATALINLMRREGSLVRHESKPTTGQFMLRYSKPPTRAARIPWRIRTNEQLGIHP